MPKKTNNEVEWMDNDVAPSSGTENIPVLRAAASLKLIFILTIDNLL